MKSFPRLDVLPPAQRKFWPQLAKLRNEGFVLYGGTAIALYLGHRESVDFDFLPKTTDDSVLEVASAEDLLAHKLKVLLQRVEEKDYVDEPLKRRLVTATANVSGIPSLAIASKTLSTAA